MNEQAASSKQQHDEAAEAASSETEYVDAEVVEEDVTDAEIVEDGDGVHAAGSESEDDADPLATAIRERDEYLTLAQRARADFENYRRRVASQTAEAEQRGRATLARGLLPAIDNLQRALQAAGIDPGQAAAAEDGLGKGVALVYGELLTALERDGVVPFDPTGERFDPTLHEAISTAPAEGVDAGTVLETLELGYRVDRQVIRPARVVVSGCGGRDGGA
jgi:molecular chaperone GrpE